MSHDTRGTDMFMAFGAGALIGAVTALLLAPKSGKETRRELGEFAGDAMSRGRALADRARDKTRESTEAAGAFVRDQKERIGHAFEEGKEAYLRETSRS